MANSLEVVRPLAHESRDVLEAVLKLNQAHARELSDLDEPALSRLIDKAFWAATANSGDAFIIAFDQDADYDSPNFGWFKARYERFVYVDRIAVAVHARGRGLAHRLYQNLFGEASRRGHSVIMCEVNIDPPNPPSDAFHRAHGFKEVGTDVLPSGKSVRYLAKQLDV